MTYILLSVLHMKFSINALIKNMAITEDKHVKFMFSKMQKWENVADFELYVSLQPRAEVGVEEIVQTTTSLQFAILDDR